MVVATLGVHHWKRLVNGYSGHAPPDYVRLLEAMRDFPTGTGFASLNARQVRWLIVHEELIEPARRTMFMESMVRRVEMNPIGSYDDPWARATIFEIVANSVSGRPNSSRLAGARMATP